MADKLTRGGIVFRSLHGGGRLLEHPSGTQVVEDAAQLAARRAALIEAEARAAVRVVEYDALAADVAKLTAVVKPDKLKTVSGHDARRGR